MKILICTTFRDFKGNDNDKIQYKFLENLTKQSYQNYELITTTFGEKKVKQVVCDYIGDKARFRDVTMPTEYRFSLTEVLLTAIERAQEIQEKSIIIWCTCDVLYEPNFFKTIIDNYSDGFSGIIHPNIQYRSLQQIEDKRGVLEPPSKGIDALFFDADILIDAKSDIKKYKFYDWGVFEYFLVALAINGAKKRINLFCLTKIRKIVNDRKLTNETKLYFKRCLDMNYPVLQQYLDDKGLYSDYRDMYLYRAHRLFDVVNKNWLYRYLDLRYRFICILNNHRMNWLAKLLFFEKGIKVKF